MGSPIPEVFYRGVHGQGDTQAGLQGSKNFASAVVDERKLLSLADLCFFTALHGMQTPSSDENSVCLSVCPSVKHVNCDKTEEKSVQIFITYERSFSLVF